MVQIEYKNRTKEAEMAGQTVAEARREFAEEFGFSKKAAAVLNGIRVSVHREATTVLNDDDTLVFRVISHRLAFLVGALLLTFAITGGVFAAGFMTNSTSLTGATSASNNFAEVTSNTSISPNWTVRGAAKGSTGNATLFNVDTASSGYTGDLLLTVNLANVSELAKVYRTLSLELELRNAAGNVVDINQDGTANATDDYALLTLQNGEVTIPFEQTAPQVYTLWLKSGSYVSQIYSSAWTGGTAIPEFYCEVSQR